MVTAVEVSHEFKGFVDELNLSSTFSFIFNQITHKTSQGVHIAWSLLPSLKRLRRSLKQEI